ncbi:reverse transcriptase domain-containing protein [Tanacetum coccineum]
MFTPPHRRDQTRYCEFHEDHGHDTNSCVGLRKEIEACIRNGRLSHLEKGQPQSSKAEGIRHPGIKIAFSSDEPTPKHSSGEDPLIVKADIGGTMVDRIYVDGGSSAEIMYGHCFDQLYEDQKATMRPPKTPLSSFSGQLLWPLGVVTLSFKLFDYRGRGSKSIMAEFMVVRAPSPYNVILGRPRMRRLRTVASMIYSLIKFPIESGIAIVRGEMHKPSECHHDIFALSPFDMTGIQREVAEHKLNIHPRTFPIRQKKRVLAKERNEAINQEVAKLVEARIVREVFFPRWIANPVMLNPKKCIFRVETGQFLEHMITTNGIEANPKLVQAIIDMASPRNICKVQSLNGRLAALGRFLARSAEKTLPFFKTLKGCINKTGFQWSEAISSVLMANRDHAQRPIYYVSKALQGPEMNYPLIEKLALALVHIARPLCRYFQAHQICVLTDQPIRQVLLKPENSGRLAKWATELDKHDITYKPCSSIKGQALDDFVVECSRNHTHKETKEATLLPSEDKSPRWTLYTNGASSSEGSGAGLILTDPYEKEVTYALRFEFPTSNNEAEYEALIYGLELATRLDVKHLQVYSDSLLITNYVKGTYEAREASMKQYLTKVKHLIGSFDNFSITQIPHSKNKRADALSKLASSSFAHLTKNVLVEVVTHRSIDIQEVNTSTTQKETWMDPIIEYLKTRNLPADPTIARKVRIKAPQYTVKQDVLYKKGYLTPWLRCIGPEQATYVLHEAHFGSCGAHARARTISWIAAHNFHDWCNELNIKQQFTSLAHLQANGQIEVTNRTLLQGLKTRLGKAQRQWVEELPNVLWAHRTTAQTSNGCAPFSLVYGSEAVLPPEIGIPPYRI